MNIRDWNIVSIVSFLGGFVAFLDTASTDILIQISMFIFVPGIIIVMLRRGILKVKRSMFKNEEKKQAV